MKAVPQSNPLPIYHQERCVLQAFFIPLSLVKTQIDILAVKSSIVNNKYGQVKHRGCV